MPILKYVPPAKKIIDNRSSAGNYYVAKCDVCGTEFFPKRRNAKYCTSNCGLVAHRISVAEGKITEEKPKKVKEVVDDLEFFVGAMKVYKFLNQKVNTRGDKEGLLDAMKNLEIGNGEHDALKYKGFKIYRISERKYWVMF